VKTGADPREWFWPLPLTSENPGVFMPLGIIIEYAFSSRRTVDNEIIVIQT